MSLISDGETEVERGETLIVIYKFVQVMLIALLMYGTARVLGAHPAIGAWAVVFGLLISRTFFDLRPNTSSFLFASIMMFILAVWKRKSERGAVIHWMIPVMILWANMHGGFVYALMVFFTVCVSQVLGMYLHRKWPHYFVHISWPKFRSLLICTVLVFTVPVVLSPFGVRNLFHSLLIAVGEDARVFRQIAEWRPVWDQQGFGHIRLYLVFLFGLGAALAAWLVVWVTLGTKTPASNYKSEMSPGNVEWPKLDLVQICVVSLTVLMAIKARRFIPLACIAGVPFLAQVIQQTAHMIRCGRLNVAEELLSEHRRYALASLVACLSVIAGLWILGSSCECTKSLFSVLRDDSRECAAVFSRMARTGRHPTKAVQFLNANRIKGVVLNEWVDGGFIAFWQTPHPDTGEPLCKVFIDGRSQAAYDVSHYLFWRILYSVPSPSYEEEYKLVEAEAQQRSLKATDIVFLERLIAEYLKGRDNYSDENKYRKARRHWAHLLNLALSNPTTFDKVLMREGINVILLPLKSRADYRLYDSLPNWRLVYLDDRYSLFFRKNCLENRRLLAKDPAELVYPDDFSRKLSVGLRYCHSDDHARCRQGVRLLMSINKTLLRVWTSRWEFIPSLTDHIFEYGVKLDMHDELAAYLTRRALTYKQSFDNSTDSLYTRALVDIYRKLADLANMNWEYDKARHYVQLARMYRK